MTLDELIARLQAFRNERGEGKNERVDVRIKIDISDQYGARHMEREIKWVSDVASQIEVQC